MSLATAAVATAAFQTLVPGHGDPMTRGQFMQWRSAFGNLLDCAAGESLRADCIAGWMRDAAEFIPEGETRVEGMVGYCIDTRLRAEPDERLRYCPPWIKRNNFELARMAGSYTFLF